MLDVLSANYSYKLQLMDKIDQVIKRMRWKASFYMNRSEDMQETYGLKSLNCPPKIKEMVQFEKDLWNLVNKLKFRKIKSNFQRQLNEDIRVIKRSNKVLVFADKTSSTYSTYIRNLIPPQILLNIYQPL